MLDFSGVNLTEDPLAVPAQRQPTPTRVRFAAVPGSLKTLEGTVRYVRGAALCSGEDGEQWPVSPTSFAQLYEPAPGTIPGEDGLYVKKPALVRARQIHSGRFSVRVGIRREPIVGNAGDWIVQFSPREYAILSDRAFRTSYRLLPDAPGEPRGS